MGGFLTNKLQLVVEALIGQQLLQESHDLAGPILVCLWQIYVPQEEHQFARCLQSNAHSSV